jgi:hypothetical protein
MSHFVVVVVVIRKYTASREAKRRSAFMYRVASAFYSAALHGCAWLTIMRHRRVGSIERVHWTEPGNLFIVSPGGIEFYQIPSRDSLSLMEKAQPRLCVPLHP